MEVTFIQHATVAGHFPGVTASSVKPNRRRLTNAEVTVEELPKEETQANATTPKPKAKAQGRGTPQTSPAKADSKPPEAARESVEIRVKAREEESSNAFHSLGGHVKKVINASVNTNARMTDDLSPSAHRFSRNMMKLSRDSMRVELKQRRRQHVEVE